MAINIKPLSTIVAKYVQRASGAGQAYTDGVSNPRQPWAASTVAAAQTWASGVQQAVTDNRFTKGVNLVGDSGWQSKASTIGAQRYPGGIAAGQGKYAANIQPYLTLLSNLTLPPRAPTGDLANLQRVAAVDTALRQLALTR